MNKISYLVLTTFLLTISSCKEGKEEEKKVNNKLSIDTVTIIIDSSAIDAPVVDSVVKEDSLNVIKVND